MLLAACVALFWMVGRLPDLAVTMAAELANPRTIIPICASLGFAYVLRLTDCDKHLVQLLLGPLERPFARSLLIPGVIVSGYIVNMAIVSQSGTLAIVGSIAVPLLLSKGISRATVGALLLLGTSMGGELFNPGAVETVTLSKLTGIPAVVLAQRSMPLNLLACATALLVFWRLAILWERRLASEQPKSGDSAVLVGAEQRNVGPVQVAGSREVTPILGADAPLKVNLLKAAVPFIPLALLFAGTRIPILRPFHEHVTILVAMILGSVAAALTTPNRFGGLATAFFEGAGFAYTHVISVTVCATLFGQGIVANGLVKQIVTLLAGRPGPALLASLTMPWGLAAVSGSGAGSASSMMTALIPGAAALHLDPGQMGILAAMGSHFGRTMSPAAAVAILSATLVIQKGATPREIGSLTLLLTKRVAPALIAGGIALYLAALLGLGR